MSDLSPIDAAIANTVGPKDGETGFHYYRPLASGLDGITDLIAYKYAGMVSKDNIGWFRKYCEEVEDPKYLKGIVITDAYIGDRFVGQRVSAKQKEGEGVKYPRRLAIVGSYDGRLCQPEYDGEGGVD